VIPANKHRYFRKHNPNDHWENALRVKYIGDEQAIADVWGWDQDNHVFDYINEISLPAEWLRTRYREITDPDEICQRFTDRYK